VCIGSISMLCHNRPSSRTHIYGKGMGTLSYELYVHVGDSRVHQRVEHSGNDLLWRGNYSFGSWLFACSPDYRAAGPNSFLDIVDEGGDVLEHYELERSSHVSQFLTLEPCAGIQPP
jgi:hypothetical protein